MTPEAFEQFKADFYKRHPEWAKESPAQAMPVSVRPGPIVAVPVVKPGSKPWDPKEREDWAMRAANDRESREVKEKPGIPVEWDAQEPE